MGGDITRTFTDIFVQGDKMNTGGQIHRIAKDFDLAQVHMVKDSMPGWRFQLGAFPQIPMIIFAFGMEVLG